MRSEQDVERRKTGEVRRERRATRRRWPAMLLAVCTVGATLLAPPLASPPSPRGARMLDAAEPAPRAAQLAAQLAPYYQAPKGWDGRPGKYRSPLRRADGSEVTTAEGWQGRRQELVDLWRRRMGEWPPLVERPPMEELERVERDGYVEHRVRFPIGPGPDAPTLDAYLLTPPGPGPFPAVLVPFYEPLTSIGRGMKGQGTHDYGLQLVRRGIVTLSIGTPGSLDKLGRDVRQVLTEAGRERKSQPLTVLAYVAANCRAALAARPEVRPDRIGIVGLSYGGKWSMFASCLDDRFACAVWSDPGVVFDEKNGNVNYWEPWYLGADPLVQRKPGVPSAERPRTGLYKEMYEAGDDLVDLHALMATRPVLVSGGTEDPPRNWSALQHLVALNRLLGFENRVAMTARPTHVPTPEALEIELAFLEYWLKYGLD